MRYLQMSQSAQASTTALAMLSGLSLRLHGLVRRCDVGAALAHVDVRGLGEQEHTAEEQTELHGEAELHRVRA